MSGARSTHRRVGHALTATWIALACLIGCGDRGPKPPAASPPPTSASAKPPVPATPPAAKHPTPAPANVPATQVRIASVRGTPSAQGTPLQVGQRYDSGAALQLADTDEVALDIAQSGRVSIQGPAALSLGGDAPAQLFATGGVITVIVPPAGDGKLVAQRLVTPRHTLLLRPGTTAVIAIDRRGQTLAHVLTGAAEVVASSTDENATLLRIDPSAAQRFDDKGVTALPPGADVTAAVAKARLFVKAARPTGAGGAQTVAAAIEKLEATLQALNAELEQGRAIAELHKRAITAGDVAQRSAQQRALATHGQRSYRIRRAILAAWEQVQLAALRADPAQPSGISPDLRSRVVAVLPR